MNTAVNLSATLASTCVLGQDLVSKMISGFKGNLLNDASGESSLIAEIDNKIAAACDTHLGAVIGNFFSREDAVEMALAFDVDADHLDSLKSGNGLKTTLLESTRKVIMLSAVTTANTLDAIENMVADCLVDLSK
ncbi:hypothetical protein MUB04_15510 [Acinetobacter indicus]|uniref:hypothetical protein n=1 Tax=Acinetobacter TaxID=469 RepID=UPI0015D2C33B|nr:MULTISPECIES: hypothetical protein [Acinetobacter]MCP0917944.1 hypothetical protein [Acinetobacter indicus]